jgi:hypothetical protein
MHKLLRWILLPILYPINFLFILLQILYTPYFILKVKNKFGDKKVEPKSVKNLDQLIKLAKQSKFDRDGMMRKETHTLLTQSGNGLFHPQNAERLLEQVIKPNGSIYRELKLDGTEGEGYLGPSGDGISSWVFNYLLWQVDRPDLVRKLATHYLSNCFGITWNERDGVSNRSSNAGLSVTVEEWVVKGKNIGFSLANPPTGPGVLTSQAVLELAARELGGIWKLVAKAHYIAFGLWYFGRVPAMYTKDTAVQIFYTQHICALNLWSLCELGKSYKAGLKFIDANGPQGRAQPWITCLAWDQGVIDNARRQEAILYLQSYRGAVVWPQSPILSIKDFNRGNIDDESNYSMMGFAAMLLKID